MRTLDPQTSLIFGMHNALLEFFRAQPIRPMTGIIL